MANKPTKGRAKQNTGAQYYDLSLTVQAKKALKADEGFKAEVYKAFDALQAADLKFSCKWDDYNDCGMATLQEASVEFGDPITIYTMRGSTVGSAAVQLLYYWYVVSEQTLMDSRPKQEIEEDDIF